MTSTEIFNILEEALWVDYERVRNSQILPEPERSIALRLIALATKTVNAARWHENASARTLSGRRLRHPSAPSWARDLYHHLAQWPLQPKREGELPPPCPECGSTSGRPVEWDFGICPQTGYHDQGKGCTDCVKGER